MNKDKLNISRIETFLNELIENHVSDNTFFTQMIEKESISDDWNDMVLVEIPNGINDMDAYGRGVALIWLYARPLGSGRKNVAIMSQLEQKLNNVIKNNTNHEFAISRRLTFTDYDSTIKWHCNVVELNITIV